MSQVLLIFVTLACLTVPSVKAENLTVENVMISLRAGQQRLATQEIQLQTWECHQHELWGGKPSSMLYTVNRSESSILCKFRRGIMCKNDTQIFCIEPSPVGLWALNTFQKGSLDEKWRKLNKSRHSVLYPHQSTTDGYTAQHMLDDPAFVPKSVRQIKANRIELDFEYAVPSTDDVPTRMQTNGTLTIATDLDWLIVKAVRRAPTSLSGPSELVTTREAVRQGDSILVNKIQIESSFTNYPEHHAIWTYSYTYHTARNADPAEFTLAYYNLTAPEHETYEDRGFNWPLWGGIGLTCIALSIFIAWFVRRKRRQARGSMT